jgi:HK97 gp10 family phage protein
MPTVAVKMDGLQDLAEKAKRYPAQTKQAAEAAMKMFVMKCKSDIQREINVRAPFPSVDGEPPHKVTGHLLKNVYGAIEDTSSTEVTALIGDTAEYAGYLELGTSKMGPRPFVRPVVDANRSFFYELMKAALKSF